MFGRRKKEKPDFIALMSARTTTIPLTDSQQGLDFLVSFFSTIRPVSSRGRRPAEENLKKVTAALRETPVLLSHLQHAILSQLIRTDLSSALTESGIPVARGFWQELFGRLRHKILPSLQDPHDFLYVLNRVFFRNDDYKWVEQISRESWIAFFESVGLTLDVEGRIQGQLLSALKTLSFQVAQLGLEKEVLQYIPEASREENPFVAQNYLIHALQKALEAGNKEDIAAVGIQIEGMMERCREDLGFIRQQHATRGTSLHQGYMLLLLYNRLERMLVLVDLLEASRTNIGRFVDLFRMLVRYENRKNSLLEFMSQTTGYLAYQIAEHKGAKGDKYITSTWPEYRAMMSSAMGGGAWVCLVVLIKNLLIRLHMPIFWHGFAYSVNYSVGFILIEETHTTLATKQPAFTASAVASSLDTRGNADRPNLYNLAVTVAKVSRSQIASFIGNLVIVFPGVWCIAWAYERIMKVKLVSGDAALKMLKDQHPWQSLSLLYACNTGVFLFLSAIIAGYVQNKMRYARVAERLETHPVLRLSTSPARLKRLSGYVEKHAGSLVGNISLGFFLGMAGFVGEIFGNHFDIRHITISAGNTSLAVYGLGIRNINPWYLATVIGGVLGIGFLNFLVSFSLDFFVAARSRGIKIREYPEFLGILWRYFRRAPLDFIRPRRRLAEEE